VDKHTSKAGKYRPWILRAGIPLMIFALLLFAPLPFVKGNVAWAFIIYFIMDLTYSVVNIPYGSLNASLTRDAESVDKLTSTRMMLANGANLLVYTLFPMFVQMASPKESARYWSFRLEIKFGNLHRFFSTKRLVFCLSCLCYIRCNCLLPLLPIH